MKRAGPLRVWEARRPYFVALDEKDLAVKRMQSFTMVMPGETLGCVGCREKRNETVGLQEKLMATCRAPSRFPARRRCSTTYATSSRYGIGIASGVTIQTSRWAVSCSRGTTTSGLRRAIPSCWHTIRSASVSVGGKTATIPHTASAPAPARWSTRSTAVTTR